MSTEKTYDGYFRGVCRRPECARYTAAGNVGAYWRGPHRMVRAAAAADYAAHLRIEHREATS